jgi:hypothetical protein
MWNSHRVLPRRSRNSSGALQFVMLWLVGVSPVRPPTLFYMFSSAMFEIAYKLIK